MTIRAKDRKILWAKAGNRCSYPGCWLELVVECGGPDTNAVLGEEAHIVSKKVGGPRGREEPPDGGLDSYGNFILLCPTHHTVIDNDAMSDAFTPGALLEMKRLHEMKIRVLTSSARSSVQIAETPAWDERDRVSHWEIGGSTLSIDTYGSPPVLLRNGHRLGSGISFGQEVDSDGDPRWFFGSSEADPDIEYWISESTLNVIQSTVFFSQGELCPFIRHEFDLRENPTSARRFLLLEPDTSDTISCVPKIVESIELFDRDRSTDDLFVLLCCLWRVGLNAPKEMSETLMSFRGSWWYDGEMAQAVASMVNELTLAQECRSR